MPTYEVDIKITKFNPALDRKIQNVLRNVLQTFVKTDPIVMSKPYIEVESPLSKKEFAEHVAHSIFRANESPCNVQLHISLVDPGESFEFSE